MDFNIIKILSVPFNKVCPPWPFSRSGVPDPTQKHTTDIPSSSSRLKNKNRNKTPAQAFTPPTDEKKMGTIWIFVYYAVYGSRRGRCRNFLVLNWGGGLHLQIWDLNGAHETERTVFPIPQVFSMCRRRL